MEILNNGGKHMNNTVNHYYLLVNGNVDQKWVTAVQVVVGNLLDLSRIIVTALCIIALTFLAIDYFRTSPSVKSEQKHRLPDYVIGIVILLGSANILPFLIELVSSILVTI